MPSEEKAQLIQAFKMLEVSEARRLVYLSQLDITDSPDMDRSRFNLGGAGIRLAKLSRGAEAENYLRSGLAAYREAKRIRVKRHGEGVALPSIAACDFGIALAYYYGALLGADPMPDEAGTPGPLSPHSRMALLRQATAAAADALRDRSLLAPADRDGGDAIKSDDLMIKILEIRKLLTAQHTRQGAQLSAADAEKVLGKAEAEARNEARDLGAIVQADGASV